MKLLFWRRNGGRPSEQLDAIEKEAAKTHKKNIKKIVAARQDAAKLNVVLKQNNITLQLAKAIGHN